MKKNSKIIIILVIGCLLTVVILFSSTLKNKAVDLNEITIMAPLNGISQPEKDNDIEVAIKKLTGENFNIIWIPKESYKEKTMAMMASGEFPNILVVESETEDIVKGVKQGAFWNIGSYLKNYPNLRNADENILKNSSFNGEIYGLYRYKDPVDSVIVLRKDWLKKLDLKNPTNIDEFKDMLKKFTYDDPDGNGINDTYGLSLSASNFDAFNSITDQIATWFGAPNKWKDENGMLTPSFMTEEYKSSLEYIKNLYNEGLIDSQFQEKNNSNVQEDFVNGKFGAIICSRADALKLEAILLEKNENSSDIITTISGVKGNENGKILINSGYSGQLMFPKKGIKTEDELKRVLSFLDKLNSREGYTLLNSGVEGENYSIQNSNLLSYAEISTNCTKENILNDNNQFIKELNNTLDIPENNKAINPAEPLKILGNIKNEDKLRAEISELNAKYVFREIDSNEYEQGINDLLDNEGENYIQKVNDLYNEYLNK